LRDVEVDVAFEKRARIAGLAKVVQLDARTSILIVLRKPHNVARSV
jgi:hypothetical protein